MRNLESKLWFVAAALALIGLNIWAARSYRKAGSTPIVIVKTEPEGKKTTNTGQELPPPPSPPPPSPPPPQLPPAPSDLKAGALTDAQVDLAWVDNSRDETGFKVYRSTDSTNWTEIASVGPNVTSYRDTELTAGMKFYYQVKATNAVGDSAASNMASALIPSRPPAPSKLTATAVSPNRINLAWAANSTNETDFKVYRSTDGTTWTQIAKVGANSTAFSDTEATAGKMYSYQVKATNAVGDSAASNVATALIQSPPTAPSKLTASTVSSSQINLAWADNSSDETGFKVYRSTDRTTWDKIGTVGANITSYSDTKLAAGKTYSYQVKATNAVGDSTDSNVVTAITPPELLEGEVLILVLCTDSLKADNAALVSQLKQLQESHRNKLIGGTVWQVHRKGCEPWQPVSVPEQQRFSSRECNKMFEEVFKKIEDLQKKSKNKEFKPVLIWESDHHPVIRPTKDVPKGGYLCYWFTTPPNEKSPILDEWFHNDAGYQYEIGGLAKFVGPIIE